MISISRYKGNGGSAKKRLGLGYKTSLPEDKTIKKLTFPQLSPPMVLQETLDSLALKVPYKQGKDEVAFLHTTKAGTKRFKTPPGTKFDVGISKANELQYNFLHDPHLKNFVGRPHVQKCLKKQGLITEDGFVKCSTREFNAYRQWIRHIKLQQMGGKGDVGEKTCVKDRTKKLTDHELEVLEKNKENQHQAKKKYYHIMRKEDHDRRRLLNKLLQDFKIKEQSRDDHNEVKRMKCKERAQEEHSRMCEHLVNEEIRNTSKLLALAQKEELFSKRKKEINDIQMSAKKEREEMNAEKLRKRQNNALKIMEEKKTELDKEVRERNKKAIERRELFNDMWKKGEEKLERVKQSRRLLAHENLQKAKKVLQGIEKRKEDEMLKWRQKRGSQKTRNVTPGRSNTSQLHSNNFSEGRRRQIQKKSNWTISECLKGYLDDHFGVKSIIDDQDGESEESEHFLAAFEKHEKSPPQSDSVERDLNMKSLQIVLEAIEGAVKSLESRSDYKFFDGANGSSHETVVTEVSHYSKSQDEIQKKVPQIKSESSTSSSEKTLRQISSDDLQSRAKKLKIASQGRRPTPIYSKNDIKRLLGELSRDTFGMGAFGEEEEEHDKCASEDRSCPGNADKSKQSGSNSSTLLSDAGVERKASRTKIENVHKAEREAKQLVRLTTHESSKKAQNKPVSRDSSAASGRRDRRHVAHVRASRSRLSCLIHPSMNSNCSEMVEKLECLSSGELIGCLEENETEEIMKIEMPDEANDSNGNKEAMDTDPDSLKDNGQKVCEPLLASQHGTGRGYPEDDNGDGIDQNEGDKEMVLTDAGCDGLMGNTLDDEDDEVVESCVTINEDELNSMQQIGEGAFAETEGDMTEADEKCCNENTADAADQVNESRHVESRTLLIDEPSNDNCHTDSENTNSKLFETTAIPKYNNAPIRSPSVYSMTVLNSNSEPVLRRPSFGEFGGPNSKLSTRSLPAKIIAPKVSMDKPRFDSPFEAGERHIANQLSNRSRRNIIRNSSRSSVAMNPLPENDDSLAIE